MRDKTLRFAPHTKLVSTEETFAFTYTYAREYVTI